MEEAIGQLVAKDTKQRIAGVEKLQALLDRGPTGLTAQHVSGLVDMALTLLRDNNFRVCRGALEALASATVVAGEHLRLHFGALLPAIVERLGDGRQSVRDAARRLLLALMQISCPTIVIEKAGNFAWCHKNWKVREEFARSAASAVTLFAAAELPFQRLLLLKMVQLLEDSNSNVREAAIVCLQELYRQSGAQVREELQQHQLRPSQLKDILQRFDKIEPGNRTVEAVLSQLSTSEPRSSVGSYQRSGVKVKTKVAEVLDSGNMDEPERKVAAVKVQSEKELMREMEKAAGLLASEHDWSVRIAAMQRIEGLVLGGAAEYAYFPTLLKQLVEPLSAQLSDRRSSVVKQVCHLLDFLAKEMHTDFEPCAEIFIPALFKLVVITVLVMAESADNCIKTMLRHCQVARVYPRLLDAAKADRNAVLRARCCEYMVLILEQWADTPELQRSVEHFEDAIRCCTADAMGEVRAIARQCYRLFKRIWPDRSLRLFSTFDPTIQRVLAEEDGTSMKHSYPSTMDKGASVSRHPASPYKPATGKVGEQVGKAKADPQLYSLDGLEESLDCEDLLSQQQVNSRESMLDGRGTFSDKGFCLMTEPPNDRSRVGGSGSHCGTSAPAPYLSARDSPQSGSARTVGQGSVQASSLCSATLDSATIPSSENAGARGFRASGVERVYKFKGSAQGDSSSSSQIGSSVCGSTDGQGMGPSAKRMPGFQRPLLRTSGSGTSSNQDEKQVVVFGPFGQVQSYPEGLISLKSTLCEGLSMRSDWSARVAAFNFLKKLLQQGPRGIQEVAQSFDKVMKLFSEHLDDAHNRVAEAALSALIHLVPSCQKPLEGYLERILPRVFARLVDAKATTRQLGSLALEVFASIYTIDTLLPALLRSLDEQRSAKAKGAVIDFAVAGFSKMSPVGGFNGHLKLWLCKLAALAHDKSPRLKETALTGIISVYNYFDSASVLNFILGLPIEDQSVLRRALKQYTPQIEVDFLTHMQSRCQRTKAKQGNDQAESPPVTCQKQVQRGMSRASSGFSTGVGTPMSSGSASISSRRDASQAGSEYLETQQTSHLGKSNCRPLSRGFDRLSNAGWTKDESHGFVEGPGPTEELRSGLRSNEQEVEDDSIMPVLDFQGLASSEHILLKSDLEGRQMQSKNETKFGEKTIKISLVKSLAHDVLSFLPKKMSSWCKEKAPDEKCEILQEFLRLSRAKHSSIWSQHLKQMLTVVLEALADPDADVRELDLLVVLELVKNQGDTLKDATEALFEKLLPLTQDPSAKVCCAAENCLSTVLACFDPQRCLEVMVDQLRRKRQKHLVACIRSLTKLIGRVVSEDLIGQLHSFLPALFDAFGNQSADVRKAVVFCLVEIYIALGKSLVPYLGSLSSTQLRLVTVYANRISQARSGLAGAAVRDVIS